MITFVDVAPTAFQLGCLIIALVGLAIMVPRNIGALLLRRRGVETMGEVAIVHRGNETASAASIRFTDADGRSHLFRSYLPLPADRGFVGALAAVIYDPRDPRRAREAGQSLRKTIETAIIYALIVAALLAAFIHPLGLAFTSGG